MKRLFLPLLLLPLTALADDERLPYTCDNGSHLDIAFSTATDGRPQAMLYFADATLTLPQVPAASGATYRQDGIVLRTVAGDALFEDGKGNLRRCTPGHSAPAPAIGALPSSFIDLTGSVAPRTPVALPADAMLTVRIQDSAGQRPRTLAEQRIAIGGQQGPIPFQMTVDRDMLRKTARLTISARIERAGRLLFINDQTYPVASNGQPGHIDLWLKPATPPQSKKP